MITFIICLILLSGLFSIAFKLTGAVLKACLWMCIFLPLGLMLCAIGLALCCTLILIPVGIMLFKVGGRLIIKG